MCTVFITPEKIESKLLTAGRPEVLLKRPRRTSIYQLIPSYQNAR